MSKHSDQTRSGHNIKFPSKWWKNSWALIAFLVLVLGGMIVALLVIGGSSRVEEFNEEDNPPLLSGSIEELNAIDQSKLTDDGRIQVLLEQANHYFAQEDYETAKEYALEAEMIDPNNHAVLTTLAGISELLGDIDGAIGYFERVIENLDPEHPLYEVDKESYETMVSNLAAQ